MYTRMMRQIRDADSASIVSQLLFLEAEEASKPIHLYINSPGADSGMWFPFTPNDLVRCWQAAA